MPSDRKNATGVSKQGGAPEPALTAENASAGELAAAAAGAEASSSSETPVARQIVTLTPEVTDAIKDLVQAELKAEAFDILASPEGHAIMLKLVEDFVGQWLFANPPTIGREQMEHLIDFAGQTANTTVQQAMTAYDLEVSRKIEAAKADILAHLTPLISAIVEGRPAPPIATRETARVAPVKILKPGDPVKVWGDPEHKTFRLGEVDAVHDGGHAYDVELDDGTLTKIGADGLEYDTRK